MSQNLISINKIPQVLKYAANFQTQLMQNCIRDVPKKICVTQNLISKHKRVLIFFNETEHIT